VRLVVFGDLHLFRLWLWPWHLFSKRMLGQLNLWLNRRRHFDMRLVPGLITRIDELTPDLLLGTGDLTTTATHSEFKLVNQRLADLFARCDTRLIPGNHDRYTFTAERQKRFEHYLEPYTTSDWPLYEKLDDHLHLVGLDATKANWLSDTGRLDDEQRARLRDRIAPLTESDRLIVMCHYPIAMPPGHPPEPKNHALIEPEKLTDVLVQCKAHTLYLHGHVHKPQCWRHTEGQRLTILNAGAPLMRKSHWPQGQGFWQIDLPDAAEQPATLIHHVQDADGNWHGDPIVWPTTCGEVASIV